MSEGWLGQLDPPPSARVDELARVLHKLAGTAAMFGEEALGTAAVELERALASQPGGAVCEALAQALLDRAETHGPAGLDGEPEEGLSAGG